MAEPCASCGHVARHRCRAVVQSYTATSGVPIDYCQCDHRVSPAVQAAMNWLRACLDSGGTSRQALQAAARALLAALEGT